MWIDLMGFDNEKKDFEVKAFLEKAGFIPNVLILHLTDPAFILDHAGIDKLRKLPPSVCSHCGQPYNDERSRQQWTNFQVKGLVSALQGYGIKVYFNVGDAGVYPWKRMDMDENIFWEDFFVAKLVRVMRDYNFDGYLLSDGYSYSRAPVYDAGHLRSDDMVDQFLTAANVILPASISGSCNENKDKIRQRSDWIWNNKRGEWISFFVRRIASFAAKVVSALHAENKKVIALTALTRDPFEAIYRYGADYKKLAEAGIDAFIVEAAAGAMEIVCNRRWGVPKSRYLNNFMAALMLVKAYVPNKLMFYLNGIKDHYENWSVLHHAPTALESEIYTLSNMYRMDDKGALARCASGPVVCLADSIRKEEWQWLNERWRLAYDLDPRRVLGATLVWSDRALENQIDDFIDTRRWTTHRLLHHLIGIGAPLHAVAGINNLEKVRGTIVVLNPHLHPPEEIKKIIAYKNGPIILIGGKTALPRQPVIRFSDAYPPNQLFCCYYGKKIKINGKIKPDGKENIPGSLAKIKDPPYFPQELYFRAVSDSFLQKCADVITKCSNCAYPQKEFASRLEGKVKNGNEHVHVLTLDAGNGKLRLFIRNDEYVYIEPMIDVGRPISKIKIISPYPHAPIKPRGSEFQASIPGRGMIILDVNVKTALTRTNWCRLSPACSGSA